jgi:hypothetical protein
VPSWSLPRTVSTTPATTSTRIPATVAAGQTYRWRGLRPCFDTRVTIGANCARVNLRRVAG